ncbi:hypothetical protein SynBIOSU31_02377 [Synechococcus sp. BIOS-U3-1]|nr:hypothetical protein SynBIOSU31_02377 [Synechococcus sp. BIOS-U3-1]
MHTRLQVSIDPTLCGSHRLVGSLISIAPFEAIEFRPFRMLGS